MAESNKDLTSLWVSYYTDESVFSLQFYYFCLSLSFSLLLSILLSLFLIILYFFFISLCDVCHIYHLFLFSPWDWKCKCTRKPSHKIQSKKNVRLVARSTAQEGFLFMLVIYPFPSYQRKQTGNIEMIFEQRISTIMQGALKSSWQRRNKAYH